MDQWYVARGNAKQGPFTSAQLRALARKGQLQKTDLLSREGTQKWTAAGKFSQLFPATPPLEPTPATPPPPELSPAPPPVDPPLNADRAPGRSTKPLWLWIGAGAIGVCLLAMAARFLVGERPGPDRPLAQNTSQPERPPPKTGEAAGTESGASVEPVSSAGCKETLQLPPVGPTTFAAADPVMAKFQKARAAYLGARVQARRNVAQVFGPAFEAIENGNLDAAAKAQAREDLTNAQKGYFQGGKAPTHPVVKKAVEEYTRLIEAETRKFGAAAEEALSAYEKQGVTDPTKLRPLLAGRLCARHPDLLGAWVRSSEDMLHFDRHEFWIVDFDERTGGFQAAGIERDHLSTYAVFHGDSFDLKNGALSFSAVQLDTNNGRVWAKGMTVTMAPQEGRLLYEMRDRVNGSESDPKTGGLRWLKTTVSGTLHRSMDFGARLETGSDFVHLAHHLNAAGITSLDHQTVRVRPVEKLDASDANSVWRRLALLSSFDYLLPNGDRPIAHEQLYIPYRLAQGAPQSPADRLASSLLRDYQTIADCPHPYLKHAAAVALMLNRRRQRLAQAAAKYGDIHPSDVKDFDEKMRQADRAYALVDEKYRAIMERERSNFTAQVPLHERSDYQAELERVMAPYRLRAAPNRERVSTLCTYADMAEVDRNAAFWQQYLLPLAKRCSGPKVEQPLLSVTAGWTSNRANSRGGLKRLGVFGLQNVSDYELTHAVVELAAENEWGDKATHYCYLPHLDVGEMVSVLPHPRLDQRLLDYSATIDVTFSVWADQGAEIDRHVTLTNPAPNPDAEEMRREQLRQYTPSQADCEALAQMIHRTTALLLNIAAQRVLLREASRSGISYSFRLPAQGKAGRTLLLRFRSASEVEAEIVDPQTHKPFQTATPAWKGELDKREGTSIYFGADGDWEQSGWAFKLGLDDQPMIYCPGAGNAKAPFPAREIPLLLVTSP